MILLRLLQSLGQSKQEFDVDDGNTGSVTLSDETNRMHRDMDMTKFKEMQETDSSLHAFG